ncbi:MAG: hypothetical protein LBR77_05025 [Lachnospiraceae bacterium]|jgi:hypothetical protein|nr:hypothetical protein [Lachnospiraceae bacterium]
MPGSMVHLLVARLARPQAGALFWLGNIAPDAVGERAEKDESHFRNMADREAPMRELERSVSGEFGEGVLLHMFVDWKWDLSMRDAYIERMGDDWFADYRNQVSMAGSFIYHRAWWAEGVWEAMEAVPLGDYGVTPFAAPGDVRAFLVSNHHWHRERNTGPSQAFPPDVVSEFARRTAHEFMEWRWQGQP